MCRYSIGNEQMNRVEQRWIIENCRDSALIETKLIDRKLIDMKLIGTKLV